MNVGFIGLGNMGRPMAKNLIAAGHRLTVYNRTQSHAEELASAGAEVANTPANACTAEIVITMLADDESVESVVLGPRGILHALPPAAVHVCMSTISPELAQRLEKAHGDLGRAYIAAPVLGRPEAAAAAKLFIVAAGASAALERCQPLLDALGQRTFVVGDAPWMANLLKVCNNFLVIAAIESMAETFALVRKSGVDPDKFREIIAEAMFPVPVYQVYGGMIASDVYEPAGFRLPLGLKDTRLALQAAEAVDVPLPVGSAIRDQFITAIARGYENFDWGALGRVAADDAGLKPKRKR